MRQFIVLVIIVSAVTLIVAATVFRSGRAQNAARFMRNVAWAYIAVIVALAVLRWWQSN